MSVNDALPGQAVLAGHNFVAFWPSNGATHEAERRAGDQNGLCGVQCPVGHGKYCIGIAVPGIYPEPGPVPWSGRRVFGATDRHDRW
jgi:hypothetical protein